MISHRLGAPCLRRMNRTANTTPAATTRTTQIAKSVQTIQSVSPLEPARVANAITASPNITSSGNASRTIAATMNATCSSDLEVSDTRFLQSVNFGEKTYEPQQDRMLAFRVQ
jgi:hypothetical protein